MNEEELLLSKLDPDWGRYLERVEDENVRLRKALAKPLRQTILAVLTTMPSEAYPEHLAAQIESQVRAWQALDGQETGREDTPNAA